MPPKLPSSSSSSSSRPDSASHHQAENSHNRNAKGSQRLRKNFNALKGRFANKLGLERSKETSPSPSKISAIGRPSQPNIGRDANIRRDSTPETSSTIPLAEAINTGDLSTENRKNIPLAEVAGEGGAKDRLDNRKRNLSVSTLGHHEESGTELSRDINNLLSIQDSRKISEELEEFLKDGAPSQLTDELKKILYREKTDKPINNPNRGLQ
ncbi:hypothetical protein ACJJI3_18445 [Microbulbifer sp. ZKSA004]|uniref:hypothetical protein n=1 Tax=Microbulbifer sp. ZKSA004 TaxID=3243389 RepID=UPI00403A2C10